MVLKRKQIKTLNYYLLLGCFILHLGFVIYLIIALAPSQFLPHLTNWSFFLSSIYLCSILVCDTSLYFFSSDKLENFNHFFRNIFSKIVFPFCFLISIGFWIILSIGFISSYNTFLDSDQEITIDMIIINTYVHLVITIIMVVELILNEREAIKILDWFSIITNTAIYIVYIISVCIEKYVFEFYPYLFLKDLNVLGMIIVGIVIYALLIGCIFIYILITNKLNRNTIKVKESGEEEKFISSNENNNNDEFISEEE